MLQPDLIPRHVAIIMDGNGRWARAQGKPRTFGHAEGARTLRRIVKFADHLGIKALSVYAFSTENWKRPITEVRFIMDLLCQYLTSELEEFNQYNVRIRFMGSREGLPAIVQEKMDHALDVTKDNTGIILNIAINYGGQRELVEAVREIAGSVQQGTLAPDAINEKTIEGHLYTRGLPAPDFLIRTGGDLRVSNFMLWQIAYSEFWRPESEIRGADYGTENTDGACRHPYCIVFDQDGGPAVCPGSAPPGTGRLPGIPDHADPGWDPGILGHGASGYGSPDRGGRAGETGLAAASRHPVFPFGAAGGTLFLCPGPFSGKHRPDLHGPGVSGAAFCPFHPAPGTDRSPPHHPRLGDGEPGRSPAVDGDVRHLGQ